MKRRKPDEAGSQLDIFDRLNAIVVGEKAAKAQARHRALEHERQAGRWKRRNSNSNWRHGRQIIAEIGALIAHRHGGACDTDDGESYFKAALPSLVEAVGGFDAEGCQRKLDDWTRGLTPTLDRLAILSCMADARRRNADGKLYWKAAELGDILRVSAAEREVLGLTMIRPHGMTGREFGVYQRNRRRLAEKDRRAAKGAVAREDSDARTKPWEALGISRRTHYRLKAAEAAKVPEFALGTNSWLPDTKYLKAATDLCHVQEQTLPVPARQASPSPIVGAGGHSPRSKLRAVPAGHARALPLPVEGVFEHPDLLDTWVSLGTAIPSYDGGIMPEDLARAVRAAQQARMMTQEAVARQIGVSRPQLANALQGRFGLSRSAATNLMEWLAA